MNARIRFLLWATSLALILMLIAGGCSTERNDPVSPTVPDGPAADKAVQRSFDGFLAAQGTFCWPDGEGGCLYLEPPLDNLPIWFSPEDYSVFGWFDYAGLADAWLQQETGGAVSLGTEISGTVSENVLADGRARILVNLHATNTLAHLMLGVQGPLIFGSRVQDVLDGAEPALCSVSFSVEFIVAEPGAPLPDLFQVWFFPEPDQEVLRLEFVARARGVLHEGSGYPEGASGKASCTQIGLFDVTPGNDAWDGYPVENLTWKQVGPTIDRD